MGKYDRFWEMREAAGTASDMKQHEVFRCTGCGAVTRPEDGWNGEPDPHKCSDQCKCNHGDWNPGNVSNDFRQNFDRIFPNAPGAGL